MCRGSAPQQAKTSRQGLPMTENSPWALGQTCPWTLDTLTKTPKLDVQEICCHHDVTETHLTRSQQSWPLTSDPTLTGLWPSANTSNAHAQQVWVVTFPGFCPSRDTILYAPC